jgi:DNA modification methylase
VWVLSGHRLACGDSTDPAAVARLLGGERAQVAFVDPPYNVSYGDHGGQQRGSRRRRIANDSMPAVEWEQFCRGWAQQLLTNVDGAIYVCMSTKEWALVSRVLEDAGAHWSDTIVWAKTDSPSGVPIISASTSRSGSGGARARLITGAATATRATCGTSPAHRTHHFIRP